MACAVKSAMAHAPVSTRGAAPRSARPVTLRVPDRGGGGTGVAASAAAGGEATAPTVSKTWQLGGSGLEVSKIGIGTLQWGDEGTGFGKTYREANLVEAFEAASAGGISFWDTAEVYGFGNAKFQQSSEHILGRLVRKQREEGGDAAAAAPVLGSKVFTVPWTNVIMGGGLRLGRESLIEALKGSMERAGGPLDLWSIHFPFPGLKQEVLMETLAQAVDMGMTKAVGVSNYNVGQLEEAHGLLAKKGIALASNQVKYNLLDRSPESSGLLKAASERNVRIVAYSPLAGGDLGGVRAPSNEKAAQLVKLLSLIGALSGGRTPSQVALNYLVCKGALPIPGCKNAEQAAAHAGALGWELDLDTEVGMIDEKLDYLFGKGK